MSNIFLLAINSIKKHVSRSLLTTLGIMIGIMSVTLILSASTALKQYVNDEMSYFGENWIEVEIKVPPDLSALGAQITSLKTEDAEAIGRLDNVDKYYYGLLNQGVVSFMGEAKNYTIWAASEQMIDIDKGKLTEGRFFTKQENDTASKVTVLGSKVAEKFFPKENAVGKTIKIKNLSFQVIGVFEERGSIFGFFDYDEMVFIPAKTDQKILEGIDHISFIFASVKDSERMADTTDEIRYLLRQRHEVTDPDDEEFRVVSMEETMEILDAVFNGVNLLLLAIAAISLLVGGVGIMNIMYVSVAERTFEIGLRKTVGAKRRIILTQFLIESIILTFVGGIIGIIFSFLGALVGTYLLQKYNIDLTIIITTQGILIATIFSVAVGLIFGLYPARKAANLDPIEALRK